MKKLNKATVLIIASMLVLALTLVATFSWFPRVFGYDTDKNYDDLYLNPAKVFLQTAPQSVATYSCSKGDDGQLVSAVLPLSDGASVTIQAGECAYFRTVVTYSSSVANTNFSLTGLELSGTPTGIKVCCLSPLKTVNDYSQGMSIAKHVSVISTDVVAVEWYLYNSGDTQSVRISKLPLISANE